MDSDTLKAIQANPKFQELVRKRSRLSWTLSAVMLVAYYGFIMVLAFNPEFFRNHITEYTTVGFPIGIAIILLAFALTGIYVRRSNREFDRLTEEIRKEVE
ncbi:MAG TPA: DUF485 domain-containing protein [Gammaproteobacteria bacterium]|jgi:uncharacterized membrane protein (DUF485 family)|nr:DUF485 domain-containing protein [Gammaproteobacteria bacterium]